MARIRVLRPRPKRPDMPSWRMTSLAASAIWELATAVDQRGKGVLTVGNLGIVNLAVGLDHPQGVGQAVGHDRGDETDKGKAKQPHG